MVCRRRWRFLSVMLLVSAMPSMVALGAVPTAADFEAADAKDLPGFRAALLKTMPPVTDVSARDAAAGKVVTDFSEAGKGINSKRAEVRLNTAIMFQELNTLSTDAKLMD